MRSKKDKIEDGITSAGIGALGFGIIFTFIQPFLKKRLSEGEGEEVDDSRSDGPEPIPLAPEQASGEYLASWSEGGMPASPGVTVPVMIAPPADVRAMSWGPDTTDVNDPAQQIVRDGVVVGYQNPYLDKSNPYEMMPEDATLIVRYGGDAESARAEWLRRWRLKHPESTY